MRSESRDIKSGRVVRFLFVVLCVVGLAACVRGGPFFRAKADPAALADNATLGALPDTRVGLCQPGVTGALTLRPVTEPLTLPACDLFFPLSGTEGLESTARIDLASQGLTSWTALEGPVQRSLEYALNMPRDKAALTRPGMSLTWGQVARSLEEFLVLLPHLDGNQELLASRFVWFGMRKKPLMTGYFTPEIPASLTRAPGYDYPIYGVPDDLRSGTVRGRQAVYRVDRGRVLPYHDRRDVDVRGVLAGRGLEIAWARDPVDVFYMQIEGAGAVAPARRHHRATCFTGPKTATDSRAWGGSCTPKGCCRGPSCPRPTSRSISQRIPSRCSN